MEERQLSLTEFSKELGIGKSSLQAYLNGQQNMRSDTIELIAEKLEILRLNWYHTPPSSSLQAKICIHCWDLSKRSSKR